MSATTTESVKKAAHRVSGQFASGGIKPLRSLSPRIWRVAAYLDHAFAQPITLREAATVVDLHPDYLSRRFKHEMGVGFHEYLLTLRLQRATSLLVTSTKSIKEIGYDVGFHAPEVFSKAFKRLMGCAPTTYRTHNFLFYGGPTQSGPDRGSITTSVRSLHDGERADLSDELADCREEP